MAEYPMRVELGLRLLGGVSDCPSKSMKSSLEEAELREDWDGELEMTLLPDWVGLGCVPFKAVRLLSLMDFCFGKTLLC